MRRKTLQQFFFLSFFFSFFFFFSLSPFTFFTLSHSCNIIFIPFLLSLGRLPRGLLFPLRTSGGLALLWCALLALDPSTGLSLPSCYSPVRFSTFHLTDTSTQHPLFGYSALQEHPSLPVLRRLQSAQDGSNTLHLHLLPPSVVKLQSSISSVALPNLPPCANPTKRPWCHRTGLGYSRVCAWVVSALLPPNCWYMDMKTVYWLKLLNSLCRSRPWEGPGWTNRGDQGNFVLAV